VGALKETLGFLHEGDMHTGSSLRLPKDLICRINIFTYHKQGRHPDLHLLIKQILTFLNITISQTALKGKRKYLCVPLMYEEESLPS